MPTHRQEIETFRLGDALVRPSQRTIEVGGRKSRVDFKAIEVLLVLTRNAGRVVTKDEVLTAVWEGRFVGDEVVTVAVSQLRKALGDSPREPRFIETIPRTGYRLLVEAETPAGGLGATSRETGARVGAARHGSHRRRRAARPRWGNRRLVAGTVSLLLAAGLGWAFLQQSSEPIPIRVEPLENLSGDPELDRIAADLSDGMLAFLSREPDARAYEPMAAEGEELEVRYRLAGTLRGHPGRVRVDLRAIDLHSREVLWTNQLVGNDVEALVERLGVSFRKGALPRMAREGS